MGVSMTQRKPMASVYFKRDRESWLVAETPEEVRLAMEQPDKFGFIQLTLGNRTHEWNGRSVWLRASEISAIAPPSKIADDDE